MSANVKQITEPKEDLTATPTEALIARQRELRKAEIELRKLELEMKRRNAGQIEEARWEIFYNRALARPYLKAARHAYLRLRQLDPDTRKVSFGKGRVSKDWEHFVTRFNRELADLPDARELADPEDCAKFTDDSDESETLAE